MAMACLLLAMALHGAAGFALPAGSLRTLSAAPRSPLPSAQMPSTAAGIKPMQDYVLVDLQSVPSATSSGVLLPTVYFDGTEKNDEAFIAPEPRAGTVVAVGPGRRSWDGNVVIPMPPLSVGQKVVVGADRGERVVLEGESASEATHFLFKINECAPDPMPPEPPRPMPRPTQRTTSVTEIFLRGCRAGCSATARTRADATVYRVAPTPCTASSVSCHVTPGDRFRFRSRGGDVGARAPRRVVRVRPNMSDSKIDLRTFSQNRRTRYGTSYHVTYHT